MNRHTHLRSIGVLLSGLVSTLLIACGEGAGTEQPAATPVRAQQPWLGPALPPIEVKGVVAARDEMRLSFKVGGVVRRIAVLEGQRVAQGQVLAEIELAEVDAQVEQARQLAEKAQRDLTRGERLQAEQVITTEQLQDLRTQAAVSASALRAAEFNRAHAVIVAPRGGTVLKRFVEERELVPAGQPVLALAAGAGGYVVKAALADRDIVHLAVGDLAVVTVDAFPGQTLHGSVREISGAADPASGLFPIEVGLQDAPVALVSGLVAHLQLSPRAPQQSQLLYVPNLAVVEGDKQRAWVFVLEGATVRRQEVQVAFITNEAVALRAGLTREQRVVTEGALYLRDGQTVRVLASGTPRS